MNRLIALAGVCFTLFILSCTPTSPTKNDNMATTTTPEKELRHVKIAISGDMPPPEDFASYDKMFFFDGRKNLIYSKKAYKKVLRKSRDFFIAICCPG